MEEIKKIESPEGLDNSAQNEEESSFDFRTLFTILILNWQWFVLSMFIFICGSLIYLRYKSPVYQVSAKMLIKDEQQQRYRSGQMLSNMQDLGFISNSAGIDNEIEILQSHLLAREAVRDLKLYTEYRSDGRLKAQLIYKTQPISVDIDPKHLNIMDEDMLPINLEITKDEDGTYNVKGLCFTLEGPEEGFPIEGSFRSLPATIRTEAGVLTFTQNKGKHIIAMKEGRKLFVRIMPPKYVATRYVNSLSVAPTSKMTSIALMTLSDQNAERGIDYLEKLAEVYNRQANADKNEIANKTEEFINDRLEKINHELGVTEGQLESYKRRNNLTQLRIDATETLRNSTQFAQKLSEANTQIQLLDYLREYVENPNNKYELIPSNVGLTDASSVQTIAMFNKNIQDRNRLLRSSSEHSPQVQTLTSTADDLRRSLLVALQQARRSADITRQGIEKEYRKYSEQVSNTPEQERILTQIGRQQEVKSGLYLMLLQKREENSISLAATADKGRLIDVPMFGGKVSPKSAVILLAALVIGFGLPLLVIYLLQLIRYKIEGHEDVVKLTTLPIVADVALASDSAKSAAGIVVHENKNEQTDEIFRSMRTNIQFLMKEGEKVILFTSSTSGEGKTFNAANLAVSFALLGKKAILIGLDIRKPALGRLFNISDRSKGVTALLTRDHLTMADIESQINPSGVNNNLDLLLAGPVPPNPTELLARESMKQMMELLRQKYDYIVLDTAPVGLVTDTLQIGKYSDVTVFVCRADYTPKSSFKLINTLSAENKLPNMCVVLNGVDMSKKKYGYYYGYGKYGKYGRYGSYGYGSYGSYGGYGYGNNYSNKEDNSIKR